MSNLFNKANTFYFVASSLATLTLLTSLALTVTSNVPLPLTLALAALSVLVLALLYKIIRNNKKIEIERNKFAQKEQELENKMTLGKEANDATTKGEVEKLIGSAAKKEELKKLNDEVEKLIGSAAKKEELKKLNDEVEKLTGSAAKKDEVEELSKKLTEELEERLGSFIKKVEVKEELQMKFYGKDEEREKITFDDVILPNDIKQKLIRIYEPNALEKGEGYILYGSPGTGKTMTAKAIASETRFKSAFISVSGSDLLNVSNINKVFEEAKKNTPCIVFIDEIDSVGKIRSDNNNVESLNSLLAKLDGFESRKGVTVIAATNRINVLDEALIRGGRLSTHIKIPTLDTDTRKKIINEYCQRKNLQGTSTDTILHNTNENFSPANLIGLLEEIEDCTNKKAPDRTRTAVICRNFKKTHNIEEISNKQANGKIESSREGSRQTSTPKGLPLSELNKVSQLEDFGYSSRCSTPIKLPNHY